MTYPTLRTGDPVLFYPNPHNDTESCLGWCLSANQGDAANLLVFTPAAGFVEKIAIRHRSNPVLAEKPNLAQLGGWDIAPILRDMQLISKAKAAAIRESETRTKRTKTTEE